MTLASHQQVEIGPWGHGGGTVADTLRRSGTAEHDPLSPASQDRRLVEVFASYLERNGKPGGPGTLAFGTLGTGAWQAVTSWPPAGAGTQRWYLGPMAGLTREAGPAGTVTHRVDVTASTGATNRWLAIDLGRAPAYPGRRHADGSLLTFTSGPLPADVHVLGFPVVTMRLATSGTDGAVYVYLEDIGPGGDVSYLTEGCLRFLHRRTTGPAEPARLGVPRTFARSDALRVVPGTPSSRPATGSGSLSPATMPPASPGTARQRRPSPSDSAATPTSISRSDTAKDRCGALGGAPALRPPALR